MEISMRKFKKELKEHGIVKVRTKKHEIYDNPNNPLPHPIVLHHGYKCIREYLVAAHRTNIKNWESEIKNEKL